MEEILIYKLKSAGKIHDIQVLKRIIYLYVDPIHELLPKTKKVQSLLYGLELNYAFCMFEDRVMDESDHDKIDASLSLYFETVYLQWLSGYGNREVKNFCNSLMDFIEYTKTERGNQLEYHYEIEGYGVKEAPIFYHIDFMDRFLKYKSNRVFEFIRVYYLAVLLADDVEDMEEDVKDSRNTIVTSFLREELGDISTIKVQSRKYWLLVNKFMTPWLSIQLKCYEEFCENQMYKNMYNIYKNIQFKIE